MEKKDASNSIYWEQFCNLYRIVHGSNEDLNKSFIRNMSDDNLQRAIMNMTSLSNI